MKFDRNGKLVSCTCPVCGAAVSNLPFIIYEDFRSVRTRPVPPGSSVSCDYSFNTKAVPAVQVLLERWEYGNTDVPNRALENAAFVDNARHAFYSNGKKNPAWNEWIVKGRTPGTRRLNMPPVVDFCPKCGKAQKQSQ